MPTTIYALCEPDLQVPVIRYIGKTGGPVKTRLRQHNKACSTKKKTHLGCWLRSLRNRGEKPVLLTLTEVPDEIGAAAEILYIRLAREGGMDLCNLTDGGDGVPMTPEIRKKIGDKNRGLKRTPEQVEENRANNTGEKNGFFGHTHSPEWRSARREMCGENSPNFGSKRSLETRKLLSEQKRGARNPMFGKPPTEEHRMNLSKAQTGKGNGMFGKAHSETAKEKISEERKAGFRFRKLPLFSDGGGI